MSQPVKVSDALLLDARLMGETTQRSIAGQIEFWARMGRAIESVLRGDQMLALCQAGQAKPLSECLKPVSSKPGQKRLKTHLLSLPYPHYEPAPSKPGLLIRVEADGKRTVGKFVNRKFRAVRTNSSSKPAKS